MKEMQSESSLCGQQVLIIGKFGNKDSRETLLAQKKKKESRELLQEKIPHGEILSLNLLTIRQLNRKQPSITGNCGYCIHPSKRTNPRTQQITNQTPQI